jgi:hypothetical protein
MSEEPAPGPGKWQRRIVGVVTAIAIASAIFVEQWCNAQRHAHDPDPPSYAPLPADAK